MEKSTGCSCKATCTCTSAGILAPANLSDACQYAYSGLVAVLLSQLADTAWDKEFKEAVLGSLLDHLHSPEQVRCSMFALLEGHGIDDVEPLVSTLNQASQSPEYFVHDLISLALADGSYDSRVRVLIHHFAWLLRVDQPVIEKYEAAVTEHLRQHTTTEEEKRDIIDKAKKQKRKRYFLIGLATVGGGALIGLTGGLAAPLVAAGAGAVIGGAGAAALGTTAGVAIIGSLFGVAGAGLTGYKMKKRVGAIEEFEFESLTLGSELHVTIAITGWLTDKQKDVRIPWKCLALAKEQYCLKWESKYLMQMGQAIEYLVSCAVSMATQEALKQTVLAGILTAVAWPASLLALSGIIDNPWSVCLSRASQAGKLLADLLLAREHGKRPVTLIGFSLGARVIYFCLKDMIKRKGCEGIIEDVILLGSPVSGSEKDWKAMERVIAGKVYNGYSRTDWLLKYLYRTTSVSLKIAGLGPVKWNNRRMVNVDLSDVVHGHTDYACKMDTILELMGIPTKDTQSTVFSKDLPTKSESLPNLTSSPSQATSDLVHISKSENDIDELQTFQSGAKYVDRTTNSGESSETNLELGNKNSN